MACRTASGCYFNVIFFNTWATYNGISDPSTQTFTLRAYSGSSQTGVQVRSSLRNWGQVDVGSYAVYNLYAGGTFVGTISVNIAGGSAAPAMVTINGNYTVYAGQNFQVVWASGDGGMDSPGIIVTIHGW
jgi:hypothetical protein